MENWMIIPLILLSGALLGTNLELYRLNRKLEKIEKKLNTSKTKTKTKKS